MKLTARRATGSRKLVAAKAPSKIDARQIAEAFGAVAVGSSGEDRNPFSLPPMMAKVLDDARRKKQA